MGLPNQTAETVFLSACKSGSRGMITQSFCTCECRWIAPVMLLAWFFGLNLLNMAALTFLPPPGAPPPAPPPEEDEYHLNASWRHDKNFALTNTPRNTAENPDVTASVTSLKNGDTFPSDATAYHDSIVVLPVRISLLVQIFQHTHQSM
jgi:hypothetical protein